jgi:hypothetical protein
MVGPQVRREAVDVLRRERGDGITRACGLVGISRSLYGYRSRRPAPEGLAARILALAEQRRRYGYRRIHVLLSHPLPKPEAANVSGSMAFVADGLADGRKLPCLVIVDDCVGPAPPDGGLDLPSSAWFQPVLARSDGLAPDT